MKIYRGYKFRMYPNEEQKVLINKFFGASRFIYNTFLERQEKYYNEVHRYLPLTEMMKELIKVQEENQWLQEIDSSILKTSIENLDRLYKNFFSKKDIRPSFKKKYVNDSYTIICKRVQYFDRDYANIRIEGKYIILPKLKRIPIRGYIDKKEITARILKATVSRKVDKYYVSICVEEQITVPEIKTGKIVGIDLGVKTLVTCSDGNTYDELKIESMEKRIKGLQKGLSKCKEGSKNSDKIKMKIAKVHHKLKNMRKYYEHQTTKEIVANNDVVICEKLKVQQMLERGSHDLARRISNASFYELARQLQYKCKWQNKKFYQIDRYYPSSQICSNCGYQNIKVKDLNVRMWQCPKCERVHDRDLNASINILDEGIKLYMKDLSENK